MHAQWLRERHDVCVDGTEEKKMAAYPPQHTKLKWRLWLNVIDGIVFGHSVEI